VSVPEQQETRVKSRSSWFRLACWSTMLTVALVVLPFLLRLVLNLFGIDVKSCLEYCDSTTSDGFDILEFALGSFVFAACTGLIAAAAWIAHMVELLRRRGRVRSPG
jgi:ABC-type Fe3+ transport system permease subunit